MKKIIRNIWVYIRLAWYSLFYGMEAANSMLMSQNKSNGDSSLQQTIKPGGALNDMLEENVTQEVEELREKHYRILKEADKFDPSTIVMTFDSEGNPVFTANRLRKKNKTDFMKHCNVLNEEDLKIRTIQDNKKFEKKHSILNYDENKSDLSIPLGVYDYDTTLTIERDGITPRIYIEKFVTKIVVREKEGNRAYVDLYLPTMASQFGKIDAILIANLYKMFETNNLRSDLIDFLSFEWYSDKAWNSSDVCLFKYDNIKPEYISVYDGSFVITFDCNVVSDGVYLAEKYMTKEMDEKYKVKAPKVDAVDIFALTRSINAEKKENKKEINLDTKTFRLDEDSD